MSDARDKARGQTSRSRTQRSQRTVSRSTSQPSGGHHDRGNQIQENIKNQQEQKAQQKQNQINENNRRRIEEMRNAQATQGPEQSIADRIKEEKTGDVYDTGWADKDRTESAEDYYGDVKSKIKLAEQLRAAGVTADQLTDEEKDYLSDVQFMQDEGVYGGVSGYEAEINKLKKNIVEGGAGYNEALKALAYLSGTRGVGGRDVSGDRVPGAVTPNEELAKISALGIQEYLNRKFKGNPDAVEDILTGKTGIEGLSPDFFKNLVYGGDDPDKRKQIGTAGIGWGTKYGQLQGDALGFDPSGQFSWSQIQDDPELYNKYLNRGTLWDDPYSGLFPKSTVGFGGGGGGGGGWGSGWGGGYGGGGGGGGFGYSTHDPMQQGYQRGQVGPGTLQEQVNQIYLGMSNINQTPGFNKSRGGIVSLLGLN